MRSMSPSSTRRWTRRLATWPGASGGGTASSRRTAPRSCRSRPVVEAGEPFERLIDHPSWIERVRRYCGEQDSYDFEGLCLDTATAMLRRTGGFVAMHPGAGEHALRTLYHFFDQRWYCGQVNILLALTDIGPGDGATVVIPASHKENFAHPEVDEAGDGSSPPAGSASPARSRSTSTRATRCCSSTGSATAATRARTRASDGS